MELQDSVIAITGSEARIYVCNVAKENDVERTFAANANDFGQLNGLINNGGIAPGFIETEMTASMKPEALEKMAAGIPLKRMGKPQEIASAAAFIFENDYVSGRMIEVDGALRL